MIRAARVLAFGLWSGAMIGFAFIFAPMTFSILGATPAFAAIVAGIIGGITTFGYGCTAAAVIASLFDMRARARAFILALIALVMSALGWYEMHVIVPVMRHTVLQTPAYEALHRQSSAVYTAILLLGLIALVWSAVAPAKEA